MGNTIKTLLTLSLFILLIHFSNGQNTNAKERVNERSMLLKTMVIKDKSINTVTIEEKEFKWFNNRKSAIEYFIQMRIKYDIITVYIDSDKPLEGKNLIIIRNGEELIETKY